MMTEPSAILRLLLVAAVALMPLRPCCCSADVAEPESGNPASIGATSQGHDCCPLGQAWQGVPADPRPCDDGDDDRCPNAGTCGAVASCDNDSEYLPIDDSGFVFDYAHLQPLPVFMAADLDDQRDRWLDRPADAFRGDTLRVLSCLFTT